MQPTFKLEIGQDQIAVITMDLAGESMNVLRDSFESEVRDILGQIEQNDQVKGVVFTSGKDNSFIAGADISMLAACQNSEDAYAISSNGQQLFNELSQFNLPIVAAIHGPCLGGGLELALACDYRVCTDSTKTALGVPEVQLGLLPGAGGTQRLPRLVGVARALDMMLTGRQLRPKQAKKFGLVEECVPQSVLLQVAKGYALKGKRKAVKPNLKGAEKLLEATSYGRNIVFDQALKQTLAKTQGNYPAPTKIIDCVRIGLEKGMAAGLEFEAKAFGELVMTRESAALRSIFFATTEMKKESGAGDATAQAVNKVMVLGGGLMGGGIASVTALKAGIPARIKDIGEAGLQNALAYSYKQLDKKVKKKHLSASQRDQTMSLLSATTRYDGIKDVDLVVEAVFEDLKLKHQMVKDVEQHCAEHTVFASNTSSLPIGQIAQAASRPDKVIGLHYFSPVEKMPLVEVIAHEQTSAQTIATTVAFARKQGKTPIVVKDGAGFYVNRILALFMNEAANLLLEGEPVEALDEALVKFGFPVGPMTLLDEVGIDVGAKIAPILEQELGPRFAAPKAFDKLMADERKGRKNGKGFYLYGSKAKKGKKVVDQSVYKVLELTPQARLTRSEISERCMVQMLNEAVRTLDEGIIASPRDGDIGAIFGIGFPPFLGGPFRYIDELGAPALVEKLQAYQARFGDRFAPAERLLAMAEQGEKFYP